MIALRATGATAALSGVALGLATLAGGSPSAGAASTADLTRCAVDDPALTEASGLAVAPDGRLFTHNDSGSEPRLVVLGDGCEVLAAPALDVPGVDPEDLARAPGPDGTPSLWLADVGDNRAERDEVEVDRAPEPSAPYPDELPVERLRLRYPDGPHDVEALLGAHDGSALALVEKSASSEPARVWVAESPDAGAVTPLREVATVTIPRVTIPLDRLVTGGDVHPAGTAVVLRTYASGWVWPLPPTGTFAERLRAGFAADPVELPLPPSPQGEAIAWTADGQGVLTLSEGRPAPLAAVPLPPAVASVVARPAAAGPPESSMTDADADASASSDSLLLGGGALLAALALVVAAVRWRRGTGTS